MKVCAQMLIQRPVTEVFSAFVDPEITTQFWFTKSSGPLKLGEKIQWDWEMFQVGTKLLVKELEQNKRILIEWDEPPCPVEWTFDDRNGNETLVSISNWGFQGNEEQIVTQAIDSKSGFAMVLAGAKAYLEHGIRLNLVRDQFPDGCPE